VNKDQKNSKWDQDVKGRTKTLMLKQNIVTFFSLSFVLSRISLTKEKPGLTEILEANRRFIYALLMMPIAGMIIAVGLIIYKKPNNMLVALGVIGFLMVQYGFTIYFFIQRLNKISNKESEKKKK